MIDDKTYNAVLCAAKDGTLIDAVPNGCAAEIDVGGETKSAPLLDVIDRLRAENERLRAACTLALGIMEQTNRVTVPPMAKFITVDFAPDDVAVLRAALEKRP